MEEYEATSPSCFGVKPSKTKLLISEDYENNFLMEYLVRYKKDS